MLLLSFNESFSMLVCAPCNKNELENTAGPESVKTFSSLLLHDRGRLSFCPALISIFSVAEEISIFLSVML